jgi:exosortase A
MKLKPVWAPEMAVPEHVPESFKGWPFVAALILSAIFWLFAWYGDTAQSVVAIWQRSETFAHGFLIVPISAWLIWRRRHAVAGLEPRPKLLALLLLALVGFGWLLGYLAGAGVVQQFGLVLMIPLLVWAILGDQVVRALAFPLFFLLFAVPFGEFLERPLMEHTADFTVAALRLTGIPVLREGQYFTIPSGSWSVVEACSGLRYLMASLTLGFLYAYLTYRSFARRAIFVAFSVIVPIVANWLRAYMIVMIGHLSGMKYATGIDHLIYGWLFFGVVMLILFWIGSFWREDLAPRDAMPRSVASAQRDMPSLGTIMAATIAAVVTVAFWPFAASRFEDTVSVPPPVLEVPLQAGGWQPRSARLTDWTPHFSYPQAGLKQAYEKDAQRVEIFIGYYRQHRQGAQLISSQNVLVSSRDRVWRSAGERPRRLDLGHQELASIDARLRGLSAQLLVWRWYWVDGQYVVNPYWAKLLQAKSRLLGRGGDGAVVMVYTTFEERPDASERTMQEFVTAMLPAITTSLENARRSGQ